MLMTFIPELLKYILPALLVFLTTWLLISHYARVNRQKDQHEARMRNLPKTLPLRLQAYERLTLFLERITVDSLVVREQDGNMSTRDFHQHLLAVIRAEYEHNLAQQIYISKEAWNVVRNAREGVTKMINAAAMQVNPDGPALELSKKIIDLQMESEISPTTAALDFIRHEAQFMMGNEG